MHDCKHVEYYDYEMMTSRVAAVGVVAGIDVGLFLAFVHIT